MTATSDRVPVTWVLPLAVVMISAISAASSLLGWTVSGSKVRNSYATFRSAQRLGLDELTPFRVLWFLVPVVCLAVVIAVAAKMLRLAGGLLIVQCLVIAGAGLVVIAAPLPTASGPFVALASGVVGTGVGLITVLRSGP